MISREKYNELVNSQKYVVGMDWGGGDTLFSYDTQRSCLLCRETNSADEISGYQRKSFIAGKKNRITVLAFWGDRCPPCITLIDRLDSLASDNKRVSFVAVPTYLAFILR